MILTEYKEQVERIPYGKRPPTALYTHRTGLTTLDGSLGPLLDQMVGRYQISAEFNLVKFGTNELKVLFLSYPGFVSEVHPALSHAVTIELSTMAAP